MGKGHVLIVKQVKWDLLEANTLVQVLLSYDNWMFKGEKKALTSWGIFFPSS